MKNKQVVATTLAYFYSKEEIVLILPILNYYHKRIMESNRANSITRFCSLA